MSNQPTLSVTMANYNHARFLPEALEAIIKQSYRPKEIIIMDDGSTDNSVEIIEEYARQESNIRFLRNERNMGLMYCTGRLLELVSGDYIYGASADDRVLPGFFEKSMGLLAQYPQAGLCSALNLRMNENGDDLGLCKTPILSLSECYSTPKECADFLNKYDDWLLGHTAIFRRQALLEAGGLIKDLGPRCDWFAMLVISLRHGVCFIPEPLAVYRVTPVSYSGTFLNDFQLSWEIHKKIILLMRTTFRDLFSSEYIEKLESKGFLTIGVGAWTRASKQLETSLSDIADTMFPNLSCRDRFFSILLRIFQYVQDIIVKLYLSGVLSRVSSWYRFAYLCGFLKRKTLRILKIT